MALLNLYSESIQVVHKASTCSAATFFHLLAIAIKIIVPFCLVYNSDGLWRKSDFHRERPDIKFKHELIVSLELNQKGGQLVWTTFPEIREALDSKVIRLPRIENYELDMDDDDRYDLLKLNLTMPLDKDESIKGVKVVLVFDYQLHDTLRFQMDGIMFIAHNEATAGDRLKVVSSVQFNQKTLLPDHDLWYNLTTIKAFSPQSLESILDQYSERDFTINCGPNGYHLWEVATDDNEREFKLDLTIYYPEDSFERRNGFWFLIKWAWIQYGAIYLIVNHLVNMIITSVHRNQLVDTVVFRQKHAEPTIKKYL